MSTRTAPMVPAVPTATSISWRNRFDVEQGGSPHATMRPRTARGALGACSVAASWDRSVDLHVRAAATDNTNLSRGPAQELTVALRTSSVGSNADEGPLAWGPCSRGPPMWAVCRGAASQAQEPRSGCRSCMCGGSRKIGRGGDRSRSSAVVRSRLPHHAQRRPIVAEVVIVPISEQILV